MKIDYSAQKEVENENLIILILFSFPVEDRSLQVIQFFPLKEINGRRKPGKNKHGKQPESFVIDLSPDHIKKQSKPKAQQEQQACPCRQANFLQGEQTAFAINPDKLKKVKQDKYRNSIFNKKACHRINI